MDKNTKVKFEPLVLAQIDEMVSIRPDKEWSGVIFYDYDKPKDTLVVKSYALMDLGTYGHTQFKENDPYLSKYKNRHNELIGCFTGLIHSHHHMWNQGPSGEDDMTMRKEAVAIDRLNFFSIIVYNSRELNGKPHPYSVRVSQKTDKDITTKTTISKYIEMSSNVFGNIVKSSIHEEPKTIETKTSTKNNVEIIDILWSNCTIATPSWGDSEEEIAENKKEFLDRVEELKTIDNTNIPPSKPSTYATNYSKDWWKKSWDDDDYEGYFGSIWNTNDASNVKRIDEATVLMTIEDRKKHFSTLIHNILTLSLIPDNTNIFVRPYTVTAEARKFEDRVKHVFGNYHTFRKVGTKFINQIISVYSKYFKNGVHTKEFCENIFKVLSFFNEYNNVDSMIVVCEILERFIKNNRIK